MTIDIRGMAPLLQVYDMPTALAFYHDVLGFNLIDSAGPAPHCGWVLLELHGTELMLNTAYEDDDRPPTPDPARRAAHGDTNLYFGCPALDAVHARLVSCGIDAREPALTSYGFTALTVTDPDGYTLTFHWPVASEAVTRWRERYGFEPNPMHRDANDVEAKEGTA